MHLSVYHLQYPIYLTMLDFLKTVLMHHEQFLFWKMQPASHSVNARYIRSYGNFIFGLTIKYLASFILSFCYFSDIFIHHKYIHFHLTFTQNDFVFQSTIMLLSKIGLPLCKQRRNLPHRQNTTRYRHRRVQNLATYTS